MSGAGRFAPSPSGDLHIGNLRTALLAWLFARSSGRRFLIRMEDLDRVQPGAAEGQLRDLAALGLDWDSEVIYQSQRRQLYDAALQQLISAGLTYECYCSRREIRAAASAPHGAQRGYPGTCRNLNEPRARPTALRLRAQVASFEFTDRLYGRQSGPVDDVVLRRNDGIPAYNLAVVVDDAEQGIDQIVRGDDLLAATPSHAYLGHLLGLAQPEYAHVPLALNARGDRLAKRDGAVTLTQLADPLSLIATSLNLAQPAERVDTATLLTRFDPEQIPRAPWIFEAS